MSGTPTTPPGFKALFCMSFKYWRSGKEVRRKDERPFCFFVKQ